MTPFAPRRLSIMFVIAGFAMTLALAPDARAARTFDYVTSNNNGTYPVLPTAR
jgi:hypothetical protein